MTIRQREIIEVNFQLPCGDFKPHPVIVLSNNTINELEDAFVGVMISGSEIYEDYCFLLDNEMVTKPMKKKCQIKCHLITMISNKEKTGTKHGEIKIKYFKQLIQKINDVVFSVTE